MKAKREHRAPLSDASLRVLGRLTKADGTIFSGSKAGSFLSSGSMERVLDRPKVAATVNVFRSSFRDWVGEKTDFASDFAKAALAHIVGDATERAYPRGDDLERRRKLMKAWADFCDGNQ